MTLIAFVIFNSTVNVAFFAAILLAFIRVMSIPHGTRNSLNANTHRLLDESKRHSKKQPSLNNGAGVCPRKERVA